MKNIRKELLLLVLLSLSCVVYALGKTDDIPYSIAKNYFVKNSYPEKEFHVMKISSQEKFDEIFGMAPLAREGGEPTTIDFSANFVIALINNVSNNIDGLKAEALKMENGRLHVVYSFLNAAGPKSFSSRYCILLIVNKKYDAAVTASLSGAEGQILVGGDIDEHGCKASAGYTWSILKKKCISISEERGEYLQGVAGNLAVIFDENAKQVEVLGFQYADKPTNILLQNIPRTKIWRKGTISLSFEKGYYILRDNKKELAKSLK